MKLLISIILCFCSVSQVHAQVSRRFFLASSACALFYKADTEKVLGLEIYANKKISELVQNGLVAPEMSESLFEAMRWEIWRQIQARALENPDTSVLDVKTTYTSVAEDGTNLIETPTFRVFMGGEFNDPIRGKERLISQIELR